ncbi:MAG TPA: TSUP family transporter [Polyangiales bacterium]|nr:TSUP family transporter [Polyangiales bacterium]
MQPRDLLLSLLAAIALAFTIFWWRRLRSTPPDRSLRPSALEIAIGFVTDFLDTLGVGSFAVTTSLYRFFSRASVRDREIPGTLNVGHALPTALQALIYISTVEVDVTTLAALIAAAVAGAHVGAGIVAALPERKLRIGMAIALLMAAALIVARLVGAMPTGRDAIALDGSLLALGVAGNFVLGAFMTLGIGLYAPCMILVSLLGMNPRAAFPIMMGSCAFLMPVAAFRFVRTERYAPSAALGLSLGGLPAVWIAAKLVRELPLDAVRWLVVSIVIYTAIGLLRAARANAITSAIPTDRS